jgi:hypothetical protein
MVQVPALAQYIGGFFLEPAKKPHDSSQRNPFSVNE